MFTENSARYGSKVNTRLLAAWMASMENAVQQLVDASRPGVERFNPKAHADRLRQASAALADARTARCGPSRELGSGEPVSPAAGAADDLVAIPDPKTGMVSYRPLGGGWGEGRKALGWADPAKGICEDEGCPHYGTPHSHPNG